MYDHDKHQIPYLWKQYIIPHNDHDEHQIPHQ